jgi:hypothetical protein
MNKTKSIKIFYGLLALGLLFLCFPSVICACGYQRSVTYRPLSDWTLNNPRVVLGYTTNWDLLPEGWIIRPNSAIEDNGQYYGYITEKKLHGGRAELTVYIFGKNSPRSVYRLQEWFDYFDGGPFPDDILENVKMDFYAIYKFILPKRNQEIPFIFDISEWISGMIIGTAYGTFTEHAGEFGFTLGEEGRVYLFQYFYINEEGEEIWPYEIVNLYEVG